MKNLITKSVLQTRIISATTLMFLSLFFTNSINAQCYNVTNGGEISGYEIQCGPYGGENITSAALPSGGSGSIEFMWLKSIDPALSVSQWTTISGATSSTYHPGSLDETTYFLRCSRRSGCSSWPGESNIIAKVVNGDCPTCEEEELITGETLDVYFDHNGGGNSNHGYKIEGAPDNDYARFWDFNDEVKLELEDQLLEGEHVTISWKYRSYNSSWNVDARMQVWSSNDGSSWSFEGSYFTDEKNIWVQQTIELNGDSKFIKIKNSGGNYPDFDVDAVSYSMSRCSVTTECGNIAGLNVIDKNGILSPIELVDGGVYNIDDFPTNKLLEIIEVGFMESAKLTVNGVSKTENVTPYNFPSSSSSWVPVIGTNNVTIKIYDLDNLYGNLCDTYTISFEVEEDNLCGTIAGLNVIDKDGILSPIELIDGGVYNIDDFPTNKLLEVIEDGFMESAKLTVNGVNKTENVSPYNFPSTSSSWVPVIGTNNVTIKIYDLDNLCGNLCDTYTISFEVEDDNLCGSIAGLNVIDKDGILSPIELIDGGVYNIDDFPSNKLLEVIEDGFMESAKLTVNGVSKTENVSPYNFPSSSSSWEPVIGTNNVTIKIYDLDNLCGNLCDTYTISFEIEGEIEEILPPTELTCDGSGTLSWSNNIVVNGNNVTSDVRFKSTGTTTYDITAALGLPTEFDEAVNVNITEVIAYDGYENRPNTGAQNNERFRVVFLKGGNVVHSSPFSGDVGDDGLATGLLSAEWIGSIGSETLLADGADQVLLAHWADPTYGDPNAETNANSVFPAAVCISYSSLNGSISGSVEDDQNNPLSNVTINLYADSDVNGIEDGSILNTAITNSSGAYSFSDVAIADYILVQEQPSGYLTVSEGDDSADGDNAPDVNTDDNRIPVTITSNKSDSDNNFIEEVELLNGSISGKVEDDQNNPLSNVTINLYADSDVNGIEDGSILNTAITNSSGAYSFSDVAIADYILVQEQPSGYLTVSEGDDSADGDNAPDVSTNDNRIPVTITSNKSDTDNNFIEEVELLNGSISGKVEDDQNNPLSNVTINLYADSDVNGIEDGSILNTATTNGSGVYSFSIVAIGDYVLVQSQPGGYITVSEGDESLIGDVDNAPDVDPADNRIPVTVESGESDEDNNFIEEEDFPGLPGELVLTYDLDPFFIDDVTDVVTYTYTCRNPGQGDVFNVSIEDMDAINGVNYMGGDTNGDDVLAGNDGETWVFESSRTWTWADGELIITNAEATAMDGLDNQLQDNKSATCFTIGANMEIDCDHQVVSPGDTITISLISRMWVDPSITDAQWSNIDFKCNIMPDTNWQLAGPDNQYFDDPSGDYINQSPGANPTSIDLLDGADMGNYPDWIHTYTYVVPADQTTDLVITGCDRGDMRAIDTSGTWLEGSNLVRHSTLIIPLDNTNMVQYDDEDGVDEQSWTSTIGGGQIGESGVDKDEINASNNSEVEVANELENRINTNASPSIFSLFPNPVRDVLNISIAKDYIGENATIELIGTNGQQIVTQQYDELPENVTIQVNAYVEGLYYVRISTEDKISKIFTVIKN